MVKKRTRDWRERKKELNRLVRKVSVTIKYSGRRAKKLLWSVEEYSV